MKKVVLGLGVLLLIVGCSGKTNNFSSQRTYAPNTIKSLVVKGKVTVELTEKENPITHMDRNSKCKQYIIDNTLYVSSHRSAFVKLGLPKLGHIEILNRASVIGKNLQMKNLEVLVKNSGTLNLEGEFEVRNIIQNNKGKIKLGWIYGDKVNIEADGIGSILIAGNIRVLDVKLSNRSTLNARYLQSENTNIIAQDSSAAEVFAAKNLKAEAKDSANIYYYEKPHNINAVTTEAGNILFLNENI